MNRQTHFRWSILLFSLILLLCRPTFAQYTFDSAPYQVYVLCIWGDADKKASNVETVRKTEEYLMKFFADIQKKWDEDAPKTGKKRTISIESLYGSQTSRDEVLKKCSKISKKAGPDDVVFVYVLCHGAHEPGGLDHAHFFVPTANGSEENSYTEKDKIYRKEIQDILNENEHRLNIFITDTCGQVTAKKSVKSQSRGIIKTIPKFPAYDSIFNDFVGSININSTSWEGGNNNKGETAIGSSDYGTAFTRALISTLNQEAPPSRYTKLKFMESLQQETDQTFEELKRSFEKNYDAMFFIISNQETQSVSEYDEDGNAVERKKMDHKKTEN